MSTVPRTYLISIAALFAAFTGLADEFERKVKPLLTEHCIKCHGQDGKVKGKVNLLELTSAAGLMAKPDLIEDMLGSLEDSDMPPEDEPELPPAARATLLKGLEQLLVESLTSAEFAPVPIRRMNRFQYNNAVVDLLGLSRDVFQLNERLMRRYSKHFDPTKKKMPDKVQVDSRPLSKDIDGTRPEGFRGVAAFPQDLRAEHGYDTQADHITLSPLLMESFLDLSQSIVNSPDLNPGECRHWNRYFRPPNATAASPGLYEAEEGGPIRVIGTPKGRVWSQKMTQWKKRWSGDTQLIWMCREPKLEISVGFTTEQPAKGIRFTFTKAGDYGTFDVLLNGKPILSAVDLFDPNVILAGPVNAKVALAKGEHVLTFRCVGKNKKSRSYLFGLDCIQLTGIDAPTTVVSSDIEAIRSRLKELMRRAYRRPADPETFNRFMAFAESKLAEGTDFTQVMKSLVGALIASPEFLYFHVSPGSNPGVHPLTDFELAERLALFIWGSIPDNELLGLAAAGELSNRTVLSQQIDRMLNDKRSMRFCDSFPSQWLQLDQLVSAIPDEEKFKHFYLSMAYRVSMHMMMEPLLLFEAVYLEDRSIMDLLNPDFTYLSDPLAKAYDGKAGGSEVRKMNFQRQPVTDPRRGGIVTNAAVMTMTSSPTRTQPITRGAWVNTVVFNDPPQPPPADVPPLPEANEEELAKLTMRERFEAHREREDCAACHNRIDPLGFALENYDPTGVWRETYTNGRKVDPSGLLFNKKPFKTAIDFKKLLIAERQRFTRGFAAHLLAFGLGRHASAADSPALDAITAHALKDDDNIRTIIKMVAMSQPFLHKTTPKNNVGATNHAH